AVLGPPPSGADEVDRQLVDQLAVLREQGLALVFREVRALRPLIERLQLINGDVSQRALLRRRRPCPPRLVASSPRHPRRAPRAPSARGAHGAGHPRSEGEWPAPS